MRQGKFIPSIVRFLGGDHGIGHIAGKYNGTNSLRKKEQCGCDDVRHGRVGGRESLGWRWLLLLAQMTLAGQLLNILQSTVK